MKVLIALLVALLCISSSCSKSVLSIYDNKIEGIWILKQISGGFSGRTTVPDKITKLTFESSEKYSSSYNNQAADKGTYTITKAGQSNYYHTDVLLKLFPANSNDSLTYGLSISNDSLFLDEGCCDRYSYMYLRLK